MVDAIRPPSNGYQPSSRPKTSEETLESLMSGIPQTRSMPSGAPPARPSSPSFSGPSRSSSIPTVTRVKGQNPGWVQVLNLCLNVVVGLVCYLNIQPYIGMIKNLIESGVSVLPITGWIFRIPFVGWLLVSLLGIALWMLLQLFELLPVLLGEKNQAAKYLAFGAYMGDLILCVWYYPPIKGGVQNFRVFASAPNWQDIDWPNVALILVTMFVVEAAIWFTYVWFPKQKHEGITL